MLTRICLDRFEMDNTVVTDFKILCDKNIMLPVVNRNIILSSPIFPQNAFFFTPGAYWEFALLLFNPSLEQQEQFAHMALYKKSDESKMSD